MQIKVLKERVGDTDLREYQSCCKKHGKHPPHNDPTMARIVAKWRLQPEDTIDDSGVIHRGGKAKKGK